MIVAVSVWGLDVDISLWGHHSMHHSMPGGNKWVIIRHFGITSPHLVLQREWVGSAPQNLEPITVVLDRVGNTLWKLEPIIAVQDKTEEPLSSGTSEREVPLTCKLA